MLKDPNDVQKSDAESPHLMTRAESMTMKCPFSSRRNSEGKNAINEPVTRDQCALPLVERSSEINGIYLPPSQMRDIFPFHLVVDKDFIVIQEGHKLTQYLKGVTCIGSHIGNAFRLEHPKKCSWSWSDIILNLDSAFELKLAHNSYVVDMVEAREEGRKPVEKIVIQDVDFSSALQSVLHLALKGGIYISDPSVDPSVSKYCAYFLLNPKVHSSAEMMDHGLSLPDLPRHSCQRDFALLGIEYAFVIRIYFICIL
jgi:hypothetical protein